MRLRLAAALLLAFLGGTVWPVDRASTAASARSFRRIEHVAQTPIASDTSVTAPRRVVAYLPTWARADGYAASSIDFSIVTHVAHFSVLPTSNGDLQPRGDGPFPDPDLVTTVHAAGAKILLVLGDDAASTSGAFSAAVATDATRQALVSSVAGLVTAAGYDGVDIDWEFPRSAADASGLTQLVQALRVALGPGLSLSLCGGTGTWDAAYLDLPALVGNLDWFSAMTYQYSSPQWSTTAGNDAPLYSTPQRTVSLDATVAYYLGRGVPAAKLQVGLPFFGERFNGGTAIDAPLLSPAGDDLTFQQVAPLIGTGWTRRWDAGAAVPYLLRTDGTPGLISFDDPASIAIKCQYVASHHLGGVILWRLGQDGSGPPAAQPLLQAARDCR